MKKAVLLTAVAALVVGCAHHDRRYSQYDDRFYTSDEHPQRVMTPGDRTYVRDQQGYDRFDDRRGTPYFQNNMEPRVRGKHPEALGWNTENYYYQRGYRSW